MSGLHRCVAVGHDHAIGGCVEVSSSNMFSVLCLWPTFHARGLRLPSPENKEACLPVFVLPLLRTHFQEQQHCQTNSKHKLCCKLPEVVKRARVSLITWAHLGREHKQHPPRQASLNLTGAEKTGNPTICKRHRPGGRISLTLPHSQLSRCYAAETGSNSLAQQHRHCRM